MKKKSMTIDRLAVMTQTEFRRADERFDRVEEKMDRGFKALADVLDIVSQDVRDIRTTLSPLVRAVAPLDKRVTRLEDKAGFGK
jgi:tetrahydromethanopterin S-methyltransferase subunit G